METFELIRKFAAVLADLPYSLGDIPRLFLKREDKIYATMAGADLTRLAPFDVGDVTGLDILEAAVLKELKGRDALVSVRSPYASICADSGREVPVILDDMAQIIGGPLKVVPHQVRPLARALRKADGALVERESLITCGRSLYEACVALTVAEKSAEVVLKASVIGGARALAPSVVRKERRFYEEKYSKAEKERHDDEER